ncbi:MFS transporter [Thalassospira sp.]|uniref:MFS transporter n=1 Tax=Thalassospira sp. TaxID=1912094 RepID=UPI002736F1AC|nr:MFS transporter [Thalassospira sp.]MDP2699978.1 MFS transporter [Thalassospira sp.]
MTAIPAKRKTGFFGGTIWILLLVSVVALCISLVGISWRAANLAENDLRIDMGKKAQIEIHVLATKIERAERLGIPIPDLVGFADLFAGMQAGDPDLMFAAIRDSGGMILHAAGVSKTDIASSLEQGNDAGDTSHIVTWRQLGAYQLVIGHDRAALMRPLTDNLFDIVVVLVVALALSFELMLLVLTVNVALPVRVASRVLDNMRDGKFSLLHGQSSRDEIGQFMARINAVITSTARNIGAKAKPAREVRLIGVRMLAFLFVLSEELARPIMPTFFAEVTAGTMDGQLGAGTVMAIHLLMIAIAMPLCSLVQGRIGSLRMYLVGAGLATIGLFGTAFAGGFWDLVIWRAFSGFGYATTFVACQGYVLDATSDKNRTQGSAMMVSGIMLADICGPAIGGIIASHVGSAVAFMMGGGVALLSVALAFLLIDGAVRGDKAPPVPTKAAFRALLRNRRFVVLVLFAAAPAKLILSGFLYYMVPFALWQTGANIAEMGRVIMIYGLVALLSGWFIARWTDAKQAETRAVGIGGGLTALGLIGAGLVPGFGMMALAVGLLGLAHATSIPAQLSASLKLSKDFVDLHGSGPVLAVLRLSERLGGALGPISGAWLVVTFGVVDAMLYMGLFALFCVICFEILIGKVPKDTTPQAEGTK